MKKILITGYCQTSGIAASLKELLPEYRIEAHQLPVLSNYDEEKDFVKKLKMFDVWVTAGYFELPEKHGLTLPGNNIVLIKIPAALSFPAFHPDLCYAEIISTSKWVIPHYNSAIALWCYKHRISVKDAEKAFCNHIYKELGYFEIWDLSVKYLQQLFFEHEFTKDHFNIFFLNIKRHGCFMHTINHPKIEVSIQFAKIIALKLGADYSIVEKDIFINDTLASIVWPIYPELADYFSINSNGYVWKWSSGLDAVIHSNIIDFLEFAYSNYINQGIEPSNIRMIPGLGGRIGVDESIYDKVLNSKYGVN